MKNWKTTLAGASAIFIAVGQALAGLSTGDFSTLPAVIPAVIAGIGLVFAHDATPAKPAA